MRDMASALACRYCNGFAALSCSSNISRCSSSELAISRAVGHCCTIVVFARVQQQCKRLMGSQSAARAQNRHLEIGELPSAEASYEACTSAE